MKKIFALLVCMVLMLCAFPVSVFAEDDSVGEVEPTVEEVDTLATVEENATEGEFSADTATPETSADKIVRYVLDNYKDISVIVTLLCSIVYQIRKHKLLNRSIGTLNNNAVDMARNSDASIKKALAAMKDMTDIVAGYRDEFASMLADVRATAEEKHRLENALNETLAYLKAAKLANVELGNEIAELIILANIPNSKKDKFYSRHIAAVSAIDDAEKTEVPSHDRGKEE